METWKGDLYAGISGLELEELAFDLGHGITLKKTYAHLTMPFLMAFKSAPKASYHPAPWKAVSGGYGWDITSELYIPGATESKLGPSIALARTILFLLRLNVNPGSTLPVFSQHAFSSLPNINDNETRLIPYEISPRYFQLNSTENLATNASVGWISERWEITHQLLKSSSEFSLAVEAIDSGQFVRQSALSLISLWGALEALFSPSSSELKFRVSSLIAAFLESPGKPRLVLQKEVARLYDKRSAAAHGKPKHDAEDLLKTFNLLRRVLFKIIDDGKVPTKEMLEAALFGCKDEDGS